MHREIAFKLPAFSFRSRRRTIDLVAAAQNILRRWRGHARLEAIAASLSDLKFNPFLFQIESSH